MLEDTATHLYREQMIGAADSGQHTSGLLATLSSRRTMASLVALLLPAARSAVDSLESRLSGCLESSVAVMMCCLSATCRTRPVLAVFLPSGASCTAMGKF